ncbi:hypothetical protein OPKNFCMD_3422 [Methylobacterium crusticola]|uniref:DUF6894 domain-containing protein n=1 Tax=Methylobacterium crusticola TaxID=1697972 RepID=A0ABQ4R1M7_9HYPH|nr:hypothetical protein [Methylobacterium crusticola]GJD50677.1 hypothetical protein OPKNFCMD_3422 [Methylobacterium crusticola]
MVRFFFDIDDGVLFTRDDDGQPFATMEAAREAAIRVLPAIAADAAADENRRNLVASVRTETGRIVFRARLSLTGERLD